MANRPKGSRSGRYKRDAFRNEERTYVLSSSRQTLSSFKHTRDYDEPADALEFAWTFVVDSSNTKPIDSRTVSTEGKVCIPCQSA